MSELWKRWCDHLVSCRRTKKFAQIHHYMKANGPLNFEPVVLEECDDVPFRSHIKLRECEQKWMDKYENLVNGNRAVVRPEPRYSYVKPKKYTWSCICGLTGVGGGGQLKTHMRSIKHKQRMS